MSVHIFYQPQSMLQPKTVRNNLGILCRCDRKSLKAPARHKHFHKKKRNPTWSILPGQCPHEELTGTNVAQKPTNSIHCVARAHGNRAPIRCTGAAQGACAHSIVGRGGTPHVASVRVAAPRRNSSTPHAQTTRASLHVRNPTANVHGQTACQKYRLRPTMETKSSAGQTFPEHTEQHAVMKSTSSHHGGSSEARLSGPVMMVAGGPAACARYHLVVERPHWIKVPVIYCILLLH